MTVGKFCFREVVVADESSTILEVAKLMRTHHVGNVVVVRRDGELAKPVGIITDRDIVVELIATETDYNALMARDLTGGELVTAHEDESLWDSLQKMRSRGIHRLVIVDSKGGLAGILSVDDVLELLADEITMLAKISFRSQWREEQSRG